MAAGNADTILDSSCLVTALYLSVLIAVSLEKAKADVYLNPAGSPFPNPVLNFSKPTHTSEGLL